MTELDDHQLLAQFARHHSEAAFATLVRRHLNLVYSAARRHAGSDSAAGEIAQAVFIILARKAGSLSPHVVLSGWLWQTARLVAANQLRAEARRIRREQEAYMQSQHSEDPAASVWTAIAPHLDGALGQLGARDRDALMLRFFENKNLREVGQALGSSEDAAKVRVNRALEKLRKLFLKRGLALTTAGIMSAVSAHSAPALPAGLAQTISAVALTQGAAASGSTLTLAKGALKIMAWTKTKTVTVTAVALLLAGTATVSTISRLRHKAAETRKVAALANEVKAANVSYSDRVIEAKTLIMTSFIQKKIPAANWCDTLNAGRQLWPVTPTNTYLALNSQVAGRAPGRGLAGDTVVYFESAQPGWNQSGGAERLASNPDGVVVAFADGRALLVPPSEVGKLRWAP